jgi:hypothetical protein
VWGNTIYEVGFSCSNFEAIGIFGFKASLVANLHTFDGFFGCCDV